ncbi:hypothetical protein Tco_0506558 [Tanacetum coccineum]
MFVQNSMEGVLVGDSSVNRVRPLPLTKEAVMSLKDDSVTFEYARSLFDVDLPTFKAKLLEFNILVWKDANGLPVRIHGGAYKIDMVINKIHSVFVVEGTYPFCVVRNMIEIALGLTPGRYGLTYEQPQTSAYELLETDLDWHHAVEYSKVRRYLVRLTLEANDDHIVNMMNAYYDDMFSSDEECDDTTYDELAFSHRYSKPLVKISEWTLAKGKISWLEEIKDRVIPPSDKSIAIIDDTIADELKDAAIGNGKKRVAFDGAQLPVKKAKTMAANDEYASDESDESAYDGSF